MSDDVLDLTDLLAPPVLDLTDLLAPEASPRPAGREQLRELKRDIASEFWDKPVLASETHIDFRSADRMARHAQNTLAAALKGAIRTRLIRAIVQQTVAQARTGKAPSEMAFAPDPQLENALRQHAKAVYAQAAEEVHAEVRRQLARRKTRHA